MKRLVGGVLVLLAVVLVVPALAQAPELELTASKRPVGRIGLTLHGPPGATAVVAERGRTVAELTLDAEGAGAVPGAAPWECRPRTRTFRARATAPDGTVVRDSDRVRTPSCTKRFKLAVRPRKPRAGRPLRVKLTDTWRLGDTRPRVCVAGSCRTARFDGRRATVRLTAPGSGRTRVTVRAGGKRVATKRIRVRRPRHLTLLATGDSMIQIVDGYLRTRLRPRNVSVRSDARISTGLSKPFFFNWPKHAVKQARKDADITVMFIGANDGFPYGDVQCCGKAWTKRYAAIVSRMMATYARGGAGRVYWCLLPAPREGNFRRVFRAVNAAIRRAAARHPRTARVVDLERVFTPGFRYSDTLGGRTVRQEDGVHLNAAGASIAADVIIRRMRRDGVL